MPLVISDVRVCIVWRKIAFASGGAAISSAGSCPWDGIASIRPWGNLHPNREAGSLEVGKSADFILLIRDIVRLAEAGQDLEIAQAGVLETWLRGASVYRRSDD